MSSLENNNLGINTNEAVNLQPSVPTLSPEELEKLKIEESIEAPVEISTEDRIAEVDAGISSGQEKIDRLIQSTEETKSALNAARANSGMSPTEEDPPSVFGNKESIEKLQSEKEELERQREQLITQQEKERLIKEEREKIIQEKISLLFEEFRALDPLDIESLTISGKTQEGVNFKSSSMGEFSPESAKSLAEAVKKGLELLPNVLNNLPDFLKKIDAEVTREATERVEKRLEEEKKKLEESKENIVEKPEEEKVETPDGEVTKEGQIVPESADADNSGVQA